MKNLSKSALLAAAVIVSIWGCASCGNNIKTGSEEKTDSLKTVIDTAQKTIDTTKKTAAEGVKKDTVKKITTN